MSRRAFLLSLQVNHVYPRNSSMMSSQGPIPDYLSSPEIDMKLAVTDPESFQHFVYHAIELYNVADVPENSELIFMEQLDKMSNSDLLKWAGGSKNESVRGVVKAMLKGRPMENKK